MRENHLQTLERYLFSWNKNHEIFQVAEEDGEILISKNGENHSHECSRAVRQTLRHPVVLVQAKRGRKGNVPSVVFMQRHTLKSRGKIHGGEEDIFPKCSKSISLMMQWGMYLSLCSH